MMVINYGNYPTNMKSQQILFPYWNLCHLHPQQTANCGRNSRLVADEDNSKWVANENKRYACSYY